MLGLWIFGVLLFAIVCSRNAHQNSGSRLFGADARSIDPKRQLAVMDIVYITRADVEDVRNPAQTRYVYNLSFHLILNNKSLPTEFLIVSLTKIIN